MTLRLAAAAALLLAATPLPATELNGAGATFPANLYFAWIDQFDRVQPEIRVRYQSVGSGEGVRRFLAREVDFGASERPLTEAEIAAHAGGALQIASTAGLIAVAYNLPGIGDGVLRLTREALAGIFAGEITEWNDPAIQNANPEIVLPARTIGIVARRDGSGTTFAFSNHLHAIHPSWRESGREPAFTVYWPPQTMYAPGNEGVSARIFLTDYSIGYVSLSFAQQIGLATARIENQAGEFVFPSVETGRNAIAAVAAEISADSVQLTPDPEGADAYPIVTYSWILVDETQADPGKAEALRTFLEWGLSEGQELAERLGYVPLPEEASAAAREVLARMR